MPQTSNSLLSPTKFMVARGNQWWTSSHTPSMFRDYQPLIMGIRSQNMPQTSNSLLSPTKCMVARSNHHGQTVMHLQCSETINHI